MASTAPTLLARATGNEALLSNPPVANIDINTAASSFLWAVFSIMGASFLGISFFTMLRVDRGQRTFNYLATAILATASVAYFALASDLGSTPITVEFLHGDWARSGNGLGGLPTRSVWFARYIDWTITTPLLLLTLLLVAPIPLSTVFITIFMDLVMIITGLIGALVPSQYKFGFFAFGCAALFWIYYVLFGPALAASKKAGDDVYKAYLSGTVMLSFLWLLYPIAWGLADGGNVIHPTGEMVFYGVLDVLAKPVFTIYHLFALSKLDYNRLGLQGGKASVFDAGVGAVGYGGHAHGDALAGKPAAKHLEPVAGAGPSHGAHRHSDVTAA